MRYLVFDIECCDGRNICEFGYVITDDKFNVLEKNCIIINPDKPFNLKGRPGQDDLELCFPEEVYYASKTFPVYYERIKSLLEAPEQIVIGHAVSNDAIFLRTACKRYKLGPINFSFFDSQKAYSEFVNSRKRISLENIQKELNLEKPSYLHKSDEDALLTMGLIQSLCEQLELSLVDLKSLCPKACGTSNFFNVQYTGDSLKDMLESLKENINSLSNKKKDKCLREFAKKVERTTPIIKSLFNGKQICFSKQFENERLKDTLVLIQLLANHDCRYNTKVSECEYYLATKDEMESTEIDKHTRFYSAKIDKVTILSLWQLLDMLSITEKEFEALPWPTYMKKNHKKRGERPRVNSYIEKSRGTTIGDIFKQQGIDVSKILK